LDRIAANFFETEECMPGIKTLFTNLKEEVELD